MSLLYYMFQSILNTFAFGYIFGVKKLIIFMDEGYLPPPFAENSAKIINLIFEPFPNRPTNNGESRYPSYQKIFEIAESFEQIYPFCRNYKKNSLIFLYILPNFPTFSAKLLKLK